MILLSRKDKTIVTLYHNCISPWINLNYNWETGKVTIGFTCSFSCYSSKRSAPSHKSSEAIQFSILMNSLAPRWELIALEATQWSDMLRGPLVVLFFLRKSSKGLTNLLTRYNVYFYFLFYLSLCPPVFLVLSAPMHTHKPQRIVRSLILLTKL